MTGRAVEGLTKAAAACGVSKATLWRMTADRPDVRACLVRPGYYRIDRLRAAICGDQPDATDADELEALRHRIQEVERKLAAMVAAMGKAIA